MDMNLMVFEYVVSLPPPSYNYAKFTDWMLPFIEYYLAEAKRYNFTVFQKEEMGQETLKIYKSIEEKVNKRIEAANTAQLSIDPNFVPEQDSRVLKPINKPYIIGQVLKEEAINTEFFSDQAEPFRIYFTSSEIICYTTESKPTGNGNLAFPDEVQNDNRLISNEIKTGSPLSYFIVPGKSDTETRAVIVSDVEAAMKANKVGVNNLMEDRDEITPILDDEDDNQNFQEPVDAPMQDGSDTEIDSKGSNHEEMTGEPENNIPAQQAQQVQQ
jgi:uncharacterized protein (UPF0297 family)